MIETIEQLKDNAQEIYNNIDSDNYHDFIEDLKEIKKRSAGAIEVVEEHIELSPATHAISYAISFVDSDGNIKILSEVVYFGF